MPTSSLPVLPLGEALRVRGAACLRELGMFGEPPGTQAVALSPVQDVLATANADGAVRLWDLHGRVRMQVLKTEMHRRTGHDARPLAVVFSPDGSLVATAHVDGAVHVFEAATGQEVPGRMRHEGMALCVGFSPGGETLSSGGTDSTLKLWDMKALLGGETRREMHRQPAGVCAFAYVGGGRWMVTGHVNRILRLLDAATGRLVATLRGPQLQVHLLVLSPDGRHLAVGSHDRTLRLIDVQTQKETVVLPEFKRPVADMAFLPGSRHLATVAQDAVVQFWDLATGASVATLYGSTGEAFAGVALFGPARDHLVVALADGRLRTWGPS